jgi:hypothetical protein
MQRMSFGLLLQVIFTCPIQMPSGYLQRSDECIPSRKYYSSPCWNHTQILQTMLIWLQMPSRRLDSVNLVWYRYFLSKQLWSLLPMQTWIILWWNSQYFAETLSCWQILWFYGPKWLGILPWRLLLSRIYMEKVRMPRWYFRSNQWLIKCILMHKCDCRLLHIQKSYFEYREEQWQVSTRS